MSRFVLGLDGRFYERWNHDWCEVRAHLVVAAVVANALDQQVATSAELSQQLRAQDTADRCWAPPAPQALGAPFQWRWSVPPGLATNRSMLGVPFTPEQLREPPVLLLQLDFVLVSSLRLRVPGSSSSVLAVRPISASMELGGWRMRQHCHCATDGRRIGGFCG